MTLSTPDRQTNATANNAGSNMQWKRLFSVREMGVYYALLVLVIVLALITTYLGRVNYLSAQNISNVLYQASLTSIIAVAMTVILVSGNFDLSVGSVAALSAAILLGTADRLGFAGAFALAMAASMSVGLVNGLIVQFAGINAFIVTLGSLTAVRGLVLIYTDGHSLYSESDQAIAAMKAFESGLVDVTVVTLVIGLLMIGGAALRYLRDVRSGRGLTPSLVGLILVGMFLLINVWNSGSELTVAKPVIYMVIFTAIVWFIMTYTTIGRRLYAVGSNAEAARLSGINVTKYKLLAFVLCSAAAGFAGILFGSRLRSINPTALGGVELTVIAAAILGGTSLFGGIGSVVKSVAGALLLFTLTNGFNIMNLGTNYQGLVEGVVLVAAAAVYTVGGRRTGRHA